MTADAPETIPLFCFRAGELRLGIVAAAVTRVDPVEPATAAGCPHIGTLLRLPIPDQVTDRRLLVFVSGGLTARLVVDGPIRLTRVSAQDLLPLGRGLRHPALVAVTADATQLVMLLHAAWLAERACH